MIRIYVYRKLELVDKRSRSCYNSIPTLEIAKATIVIATTTYNTIVFITVLCSEINMAMNQTRAFTSKNIIFRQYVQRNIHQHPRYTSAMMCNKLHATCRHYSDTSGSRLGQQPVPPLKDTMERFVKSCMPFLNKTEYEQTKKLAAEMVQKGSTWDQLQNFLLDRSRSTENWLADWWLNIAYLEFRKAVVMWSSPGLMMPLQQFACEKDRLNYAAKTIVTAMDYKKLIDENKIPQEKMGKDNLDMQQYHKIFGTIRIPRSPRDCLQYNPKSRHIIVVYKNNFFQVPLFGDDGIMVDQDQLACILQIIVDSGTKVGPAIGILTSNDRDSWTVAREMLMKNENNKDSICCIEKALFMVCLDKYVEHTDIMTKCGEQYIHGGGVCSNSANRWFDKTVQFIIGPDGTNGLTYEHSPAEGVPIAVMIDFLVTNGAKPRKAQGTSCVPTPKPLCFCVSKESQSAIDDAILHMDKIVHALDMNCFKFDCFGSNFVKSAKFSPDSFFQLAIQFAFYRLHCTPGAHYEAGATRKFLHGRTETIRSCSVESICFSRLMLEEKRSDADRMEYLQKAINAHKEYAKAAVNGLGVDRHLLGLRKASQELNLELPELFSDPGFQRSSHMRLSTSQVANKCDALMCYGPLVPDGYGVCYNIRPDDINVGISSFRCNNETSSCKFRNSLVNSLTDMRDLVLRVQKAKL